MLRFCVSERTHRAVLANLSQVVLLPMIFSQSHYATLVAFREHQPERILNYLLPFLVLASLAGAGALIILIRLSSASVTCYVAVSTREKLEALAIVFSFAAVGMTLALTSGMTYAYLLEAYFPLMPYYPALASVCFAIAALTILIIYCLIVNGKKAGAYHVGN